jgi:hypothetical protein
LGGIGSSVEEAKGDPSRRRLFGKVGHARVYIPTQSSHHHPFQPMDEVKEPTGKGQVQRHENA